MLERVEAPSLVNFQTHQNLIGNIMKFQFWTKQALQVFENISIKKSKKYLHQVFKEHRYENDCVNLFGKERIPSLKFQNFVENDEKFLSRNYVNTQTKLCLQT